MQARPGHGGPYHQLPTLAELLRSATGRPSGPGQGPRGFPRGQPPPIEREPTQRIGDEQRYAGTPGHRGTRGQSVNDHGDLAARIRDRLT